MICDVVEDACKALPRTIAWTLLTFGRSLSSCASMQYEKPGSINSVLQ